MATNFLYNFVRQYNITRPLFIGYLIGFALILYFTFFTIFGQKGLFELSHLKKKIENKEISKQELQNKMQAKKNMVEGMNINSLDVDLVDEESRKVLGYVGKNEVVIYKDNNQKKQ